MIEIKNGRVFVDGKETTDATLIGYALLDAAEAGQELENHLGSAKKLQALVDNEVEFQLLEQFVQSKLPFMQYCDVHTEPPFNINWPSSGLLINLIEMLRAGTLIFKPNYMFEMQHKNALKDEINN